MITVQVANAVSVTMMKYKSDDAAPVRAALRVSVAPICTATSENAFQRSHFYTALFLHNHHARR